jgi:septum formation inhibitor MinC
VSDNFYNSGDESSGSSRENTAVANAMANVARPLVTARGTYDGLILRLDGKADWVTLKEAILEYIDSRRDFFAGNPASIEWFDEIPSDAISRELKELLKSHFSMEVTRASLATEKKPLFRTLKPGPESASRASSISERIANRFAPRKNSPILDREVVSMSVDSSDDSFSSGARAPSLFDGVDSIATTNNSTLNSQANASATRPFVGLSGVDARESGFGSEFPASDGFGLRSAGRVQQVATASIPASSTSNKSFDSGLWDDPDTRLVFATLRSGERIETEHSLVVFGDVNPGAEIVAGGDIVVLGVLRGTAHAGAYEETGGGRVIFALNLTPTQLRIGSLISRGGTEGGGHSPEVAKIENASIVVQPYSSRQMGMRRR